MRILLLAVFLSALAMAQTPASDAQTGKTEDAVPPAAVQKQAQASRPPGLFLYDPKFGGPQPLQLDEEMWKKWTKNRKTPTTAVITRSGEPGAITVPSDRPCAIPLRNVLKPKSIPDRIVRPLPSSENFPMVHVVPPAPSCEDVKK